MKRPNAGSAAGMLAKVISVAVVAALLGGCPKQPIIDKPVPVGSKDQVVKALNERAKAMHSLVADLSVKLQTSKMDHPEGCDGSLAILYPDKLRIKGSHPLLDYAPFDIGSDGTTWFWHGHFQQFNEMHYGTTAWLDQKFEPMALLKPRDVVMALGCGPIVVAANAELYFSRHPGYYELTELSTTAEGRYMTKRIYVDPDLMAIYRLETYRPDTAIDMIAEMTFDANSKNNRGIPTGARIRLLRTDAFLLDLTLKDRKTGEEPKVKLFAMPSTEGIPVVKAYGAGAATDTAPRPLTGTK